MRFTSTKTEVQSFSRNPQIVPPINVLTSVLQPIDDSSNDRNDSRNAWSTTSEDGSSPLHKNPTRISANIASNNFLKQINGSSKDLFDSSNKPMRFTSTKTEVQSFSRNPQIVPPINVPISVLQPIDDSSNDRNDSRNAWSTLHKNPTRISANIASNNF